MKGARLHTTRTVTRAILFALFLTIPLSAQWFTNFTQEVVTNEYAAEKTNVITRVATNTHGTVVTNVQENVITDIVTVIETNVFYDEEGNERVSLVTNQVGSMRTNVVTNVITNVRFSYQTNVATNISPITREAYLTNVITNRTYSNYLSPAFIPYASFSAFGRNTEQVPSLLIGTGVIWRALDMLDVDATVYFDVNTFAEEPETGFAKGYAFSLIAVGYYHHNQWEQKIGVGIGYSMMTGTLSLNFMATLFARYIHTKTDYYYEFFTFRYSMPFNETDRWDSKYIALDVIKFGFAF